MIWQAHIFQKAQVTLNKNAHNLQHHFGAQFFMLFHMVWFILFGVLGRETTFSLVEVLQQPIRNFHFKVFRANTRSKMDHIMWKSMKNWAQKWCRSLCAFLFEATCAFRKMWAPILQPALPYKSYHQIFVSSGNSRKVKSTDCPKQAPQIRLRDFYELKNLNKKKDRCFSLRDFMRRDRPILAG